MSAVTDIKLAARLLLKERWFTLAAASALALASTSAIVARASLLAASVPARRAGRIEAMSALRG
jgi:hypothetical protein